MKLSLSAGSRDLFLLTIFLVLFFGAFLGTRPLMSPDEGRYAEISREMAASGDYVTPRLNGIKYFEKPPLFYWIEASTIRLFGLSEWSLRFPTALIGLLGCLLVYFATLKLYDRRSALLASFILATSTLYYTMSHWITPDLPLTVFLSACLLLFLLGTQELGGPRRKFYFWGMYACAALATLTKGLVGVVFPGAIIFIWLCVVKDWRQLKTYYLPSGILIFLFIAVPWHILVQLRNPEFFEFYFLHQHFLRYLTDYAQREQPFWFIAACLAAGFLPWTCFVLQSIASSWPNEWWKKANDKESVFLIIWGSFIFLFFTFSHSQLLAYALPIIPPLAILTGHYFSSIWDRKQTTPLTWGFIVLLVVGFLLTVAGVIAIKPQTLVTTTQTGLNLVSGTHNLVGEVIQNETNLTLLYSRVTLGLFAATCLIAVLLYWMKGIKFGFIVLIIGMSGVLVGINLSYGMLDKRPIKALAMKIKPLLTPNTEVVAYHYYYQDLPVYLQRRILTVGYKGELKHGMEHQDTSAWMLDEDEFWQRWKKPSRIFMLMDLKDYYFLIDHLNFTFYLLEQIEKNMAPINTPNAYYLLSSLKNFSEFELYLSDLNTNYLQPSLLAMLQKLNDYALLFLLKNEENYTLYPLAQTSKTILLTNHPL